MFYSHLYLRKNGRFGLVWLAATHSRVLSRRELTAVNVAVTVNDILEHIPGQFGKGVYNRPRRFSLYLSSQLLYGSVKILQKQWDFLFSDITGLLRKFNPDISPTNDIDLIIVRQEPVTLESCVPTSIKDKCYDPFFGVFKENVTDVEALLATWDDGYVRKETLQLESSLISVKPEIGSPNSVSDARKIQILDYHDISISSMAPVPGEQDLPILDAESLALIESADQHIEIPAEELVTQGVSRILTGEQDISHFLPLEASGLHDQLTRPAHPIEETPAVKTAREQPNTPQKPKRKRRNDGEGSQKNPKSLDTVKTGSSDEAAREKDHHTNVTDEGVSTHQLFQNAQIEPEQQLDNVEQIPAVLQTSPARQSQDWLQTNLRVQLTPVAPSPSPVRKRQPHKLIIDETLQLTRLELKQNMTSSSDTSNPLVLPTTRKIDFFKEPGSKALSHPGLQRLWTRNCKFGLRVSEHEAASPSFQVTPLDPPKSKRRRITADHETPGKLLRTDFMPSEPASIEKGRDTSNLSAANESRDRSRSLVGAESDHSAANISIDQHQISNLSDQERSLLELDLAPLPEEREQIESPQPAQLPIHIPRDDTLEQNASLTTSRSFQNNLRSLVHEKREEGENWTTFRKICPPGSSSKITAIELFQELCNLVGMGALKVRQDEPYGEIFIWERDE